jgi:hypothetical protein
MNYFIVKILGGVGEDGRKIRKFKEHRTCQYHGCHKILSIYNPNRFCFTHIKKYLIQRNEATDKSMHWNRLKVCGPYMDGVKPNHAEGVKHGH